MLSIILCSFGCAFSATNKNAPDIKEINKARTILGTTNILYPVEGIDTNIISMAQDIVNTATTGVAVSIDITSNSQINNDGTITYGDLEVINNIIFKLTKNLSTDTQSMTVEVPSKYIDYDALEVTNAKNSLDKLVLSPIENTDLNIKPSIQDIVNDSSIGVEVNIVESNNSQIDAEGNITYGKNEAIGNVTIGLTKNDANELQTISVVIPAKINTSPIIIIDNPVNNSVYEYTNNITFIGNAIDKEDGNLSNNIEWISSWEGSLGRGATLSTTKLRIGTHTITARVPDSNGLYSSTKITIKINEPIGANVINYGAKGNDTLDDTIAIQKTIDYVASIGGGTVYIPDGTYMINAYGTAENGGIKPKSNIRIILSNNAILQAIATSGSHYQIVWFNGVNNSSISGGKIIGDRNKHLSTGGEWGYGIWVNSSNNISVSNIKVSDCWGDGILVGGNKTTQYYSQNVIIENFVCDNNRRQGISIISAKDLIIRNGILSNTNGTAPQAGIDFEPNVKTNITQNVLMENVQVLNNYGWGIDFWFYNLIGGTGEKVTIKINNCTVTGNKKGQIRYGSGFTSANSYYNYLDITVNGVQIGKK